MQVADMTRLSMPRKCVSNRILLIFTLVLAVTFSLSAHPAEYVDGWADGEDEMPDRSTWAAHYRENAHIHLGREQRLPNGVSWRVLVDTGTGIGMPRITWMADKAALRTANRLLDTVHGGAMLFAAQKKRELLQLNEIRRAMGFAALETNHAVKQTDVSLTYASARFLSVVDLEFVVPEGTGVTRIIRGLTFDLEQARIFRIDACPGSEGAYGEKDHLFRFGDLLAACDVPTYRRFVDLVTTRGRFLAEQNATNKDQHVMQCSERAGPFIGPDQDIVLYLTVNGLAVHNTSFWPNASRSYCPLTRSPVNPVVIPYSDLEPFMKPGPLKDELLAAAK